MKRSILPFVFLLSLLNIDGQTVENILVEQDGELLNIHYRIGGSTSEQLYFVTLTCSIDKGPVFEPKTVRGDVGANIRGGKSNNTIIWDVFKDVEEIGSIEFFVEVDLTADESANKEEPVEEKASEKLSDRLQEIIPERKDEEKMESGYSTRSDAADGRTYSGFIGYDGSTYHLLGVRGGVINNWGGYMSVRYGGYDAYSGLSLMVITGGVSKRILNLEKFDIHGFTGMGIGDYLDEFEFELGVILIIADKVNINLGASANQWYGSGIFGIGYVF